MFWPMLHRNYCQLFALRQWLSRRFTAAGRFALLSLLVIAVLGLDITQTMAYQAFTFLAAVYALAALWTFLRLPRPFLKAEKAFEVARQLPRFGTVGQSLSYRVTVRNRQLRPQRGLAWIEELDDPRPSLEEFAGPSRRRTKGVVDWLDKWLGFSRWQKLLARRQPATIPEQPVPDLPPRDEMELRMVCIPQRRGRAHFNSVILARPDILGLTRCYYRLRLEQSLLILPKRYVLPSIALPGVREYQPAGVSLATSVGQSDEFVSLRDYRPGDPLRHIHWRSVAKVDRLVVREHEDECFVRHALILDTFAGPDDEVFEEAVAVAASFVCTVPTQESLLDLLFVGPEAYCFTAGRGMGQVDRLLEILAGVNVCADKPFSSLEKAVLRHAPLVSGCVCVFLAWDEPRQQLVGLLQSLGVPLRVCVVADEAAPAALDPGPMRRAPQHFHHLRLGNIQETLAQM